MSVLSLKGYRIKKCNHCHEYFSVNSVKSRRKIYCDRNSPYEGFEHLNCEQAVRNILTKLKRKYSRIYENFENTGTIYRHQDFINECKILKEKIKKESSVENLKEYEQYLNTYKLQKQGD